MKQHIQLTLVAVLVLCVSNPPAWAWYGKGHVVATELALDALPDDMPTFFREGSEFVTGIVTEPDVFSRPGVPWELRSVESQEHFFDLEFLTDAKEPWKLPATRFEFLEQCYDRKIKPYRVGLAPYAVVEWTQRLTVAFAEHRRWPDDKAIQQKCLLYAGFLAHYAQDICQPLHTTIHYDGRVKTPSDLSPRTGIHNKIDSLIGRLDTKPADVLKDLKIAPVYDRLRIEPKTVTTMPTTTATSTTPTTTPTALRPSVSPLLQAVLAQIEASHKLVDQVYEMESVLPDFDYTKPLSDNATVHDFALERLRETTRFTAALYLTAWRDSEFIEIPDWVRGRHE